MNLRNNFLAGSKKGIPIALGYIPIAITFGIIASSYGIPKHISIIMSASVFAGASQFIAVNLLNLESNYWQIIITTFIVNLRHSLMTASVAEKIKDRIAKEWIPILSFGITDETFSLISLSSTQKLNSGFILGINTVAYLAWVLGTVAGVYLGKNLPQIIQTSMSIALYVMFIGLLIPSLKKSHQILITSLITLAMSFLFYYGPSSLVSISKGWKIIIITILASAIGSLLFPEEVEEVE